MHIDLNSCFASAEQQANPLLRGKPVVVAAYTTPNGCVISPSVEAKQVGIRLGMTVRDARLVYRGVIVRPPDPPKYRDIHTKFCRLFRDYSPSVTPKSIDEAVLDFDRTPAIQRGLVEVGKEIKHRMKKEVGDWLRCSIGIAPNRFLAKVAAGLHKPDGLDVIDHTNLQAVYQSLTLLDFPGINLRFQARLHTWGIQTPLDFYNASMALLQRQIFKSICGIHWYYRLRGWEVDQIDFGRKSYGQSYALGKQTNDPKLLHPMLMKLCAKMGRRLRRAGFVAYGISIFLLYKDNTHWHRSQTFHGALYTTLELYTKALYVFNHQPERKVITHLHVACFHLEKTDPPQLELFDTGKPKRWAVSDAVDKINNRYGEFCAIPASMSGMDNLIVDRVAFGGVKELEDLYGEATI